MNQRVATVVVLILVFAMVGTIAWNEYLAGSMDAWERAGGSYESAPLLSAGVRESITSTTKPMLANSLSPMSTKTQTPIHPGVPSPTPPSTLGRK